MEINPDDISNFDSKMGDYPEESSWTFYIEGFMCENDIADDQNSCFSSEYESPSLVSDAASSTVKRFKDKYRNQEDEDIARVYSGKSNYMATCKQSCFMKQKKKAIHDLEDTASSPVNSPKMSCSINQSVNQRENVEMNVSVEKRNVFSMGRALTSDCRDAEHTNLKKRSCG